MRGAKTCSLYNNIWAAFGCDFGFNSICFYIVFLECIIESEEPYEQNSHEKLNEQPLENNISRLSFMLELRYRITMSIEYATLYSFSISGKCQVFSSKNRFTVWKFEWQQNDRHGAEYNPCARILNNEKNDSRPSYGQPI